LLRVHVAHGWTLNMDVKRLVVCGICAGLGAFFGGLLLGNAWGAALGGGLGPVVGEVLYRWIIRP
jgi:hypothetical protein